MAGIGSRFVALLLDHLIQFGVYLVLALVVLTVLAATGHQGVGTLGSKWFFAAVIFVAFLIFWGYFALFEAFWHGQTPGKRVMKLRVIKDSGRQITLFESLARNLLRYIDYLPSLYLVGVITMLANKRNKRLGDLAAGTLVVHERTDVQPLLWAGSAQRSTSLFAFPPAVTSEQFGPWSPKSPESTMFPADAVARLTSHDLVVIETFFARALDLPLETRAAMAYRILGELTGKMQMAAPEGNPERALEALAGQMRGQARR